MQKFKVTLAENAEQTPSSGLQHPSSNHLAASLEQTTQIISGISFITRGSHIAYVSTQIKQSHLN